MGDVSDKTLKARVNRIAGQLAGIGRMVDEGRYCVDILNQTPHGASSPLKRLIATSVDQFRVSSALIYLDGDVGGSHLWDVSYPYPRGGSTRFSISKSP